MLIAAEGEVEMVDAAVAELAPSEWGETGSEPMSSGETDVELNDVQYPRLRRARHINDLPAELVPKIYAFIEKKRDKHNFLETQRRWFDMCVDDLWVRPALPEPARLEEICAVLAAPSPTANYGQMIRRLNLTQVADAVRGELLVSFTANCSNLERLVLTGAKDLSKDDVGALISRNRNMTSIDVSQIEAIDDDTLAMLAHTCRWLQGLYAVSCSALTDTGVIRLANSCHMLRRIKLANCPIVSDAGVLALVWNCRGIVELDLSQSIENEGPGILDETVREILTKLRSLRELRLTGHRGLTDDAFAVPPAVSDGDDSPSQWQETGRIDANACANLRLVDVSSCANLSDVAVERLVALAPRLHHVALGRCPRMTDSALKMLSRLELSLHYLHMGHCNLISDRGVEFVAKRCARLQYIDVANCAQLTNATVRYLSALPRLRRIGLVKCVQINDMGIIALTERSREENTLERIHLSYCQNITEQAVMKLVNSAPRLTHLSLTGISTFSRREYTQFCRAPPPGLNDHQQSTFCVFSGEGVAQLRDYFNEAYKRTREAAWEAAGQVAGQALEPFAT